MKYNHVIILLIISIIALIGATQLFVNQQIKNQRQHFTIINLSGKQRMFSQAIVKNVLKIKIATEQEQNTENLKTELRNLVDEFSLNHKNLQNENAELDIINHNSEATQSMFEELKPSYNTIKENALQLIIEKNPLNVELIINSILTQEVSFLAKMDAITYQYNLDYIEENQQLARLHFRTILFIIVFLLLEVIFLVRPTFKKLIAKNQKLHEQNELLILQNQEIDQAKINVKTQNRNLEQERQSLSKQKDVLMNQLDEVSESVDISQVFIKNLTYGMRVPLNAMIGMLRLLDKTSPTDEQNRHISSLTKIAKNSLGNINNVISFQELEANKIKLERKVFDIKTTIQNVQESLLPITLEKSVALDVQISENIPTSLIGDTRRLKHIVYNLTYNAIKASQNGSVSIDVFLNHINKENMAHLDFAISDSSYGVSDAASPYVFELIQPKGKTTHYNNLELAIAKKLLELQGSSIIVESIIGKGTTFYFTLILPVSQ